MTETADLVIFGAGPAGLAAALAATNERWRVVLLEIGTGAARRQRDNPADLVTGVGGAGLYSDGKLSFYPSASQLWRLRDRKALRDAYSWLASLLSDSTEIPPFPSINPDQAIAPYSKLREKTYLSKYIGFDERLNLISQLSESVGTALVTGSTVTRLERHENELAVSFENDGQLQTIRSRTAILACGRFGGLELNRIGGLELNRIVPWIPTVFRRYEVGVRLESASEAFFLQHHSSLDPKYIITRQDGTEWRTFCVCRNGEVVRTDFLGLTTYSGRSDTRTTKSSNVGLNVRITEEPEPESQLQKEIYYLLAGRVPPFQLELQKFMHCETIAYGPHIDELLRKGISMLLPNASQEAWITGPCIEGVGYYPDIDGNLRIQDLPMWVAGDESGVFRGLTAAFLSGYYAARQVHQYLSS